jgi:hypothetical protein
MIASVRIDLPQPIFERLRSVAEQQQQSIPDTVNTLINQVQPSSSSLRNAVEHEIAALSTLPDEVLLLVIQNPMPQQYQEELADLNDKVQQTGRLSNGEQQRQSELLAYYQNAILRRSYCVEILRRRGRDLSSILQLPQTTVV